MLIDKNPPFKAEYTTAFGKIKDKPHQNTDTKRLPEEKVDIKIISAVNKLVKAQEGKAQGTVMDIQEIKESGIGVQSSSVQVSPKKTSTASVPKLNQSIKEELNEIAAILQEALLRAQQENNSLGDMKVPEFDEIRSVNMLTSSMVKNFSSSKIGQLISQMTQVEAKIASIMLFCKEKNLKVNALNTISDCTKKLVALKGKEEFNALGSENDAHETASKKIFAPKKGYSR